MLPGKAPEVKLATGQKLLIWWTLEACGEAGIVDCKERLRGPPGNPSDPGLGDGPSPWPPYGRGARGRCRGGGLRAPRPKLGRGRFYSPGPLFLLSTAIWLSGDR